MNYKKLFASYVWKLRLEAAAKALLTGLVIGFALGAVATVVSRAVIWECDIMTMMLYSLYASLILTVPCYLFYRPNIKKAAKRVDELNLFDRMSTMLALKDDDSYIAKIQREDAVEKLKTVKPSKMPFKVSYKLAASVGAMIVALCLVSLLPYRQLEAAAAPLPPEIVEESRIIKDLIAQLRVVIEEAEVDDELKDELNGIVDELEATVDDFDTTLEKAAKISEARSKILAIIQREVEGVNLGDALLEDEATEGLGEAINSGDSQKIYDEFEKIRQEMLGLTGEERQQWLEEMAGKLNSAIDAAGGIDEENPDEIMQAIKDMADLFQQAADSYGDETVENPDDTSAGLAGVGISGAGESIVVENEKREELSEELNKILGVIEEARNELFGTDGTQGGSDDESNSDDTENGDTENGDTENDEIAPGPGGSSGEDEEEEEEEDIFIPEGGVFGEDFELTDEHFIRDVYEQIIVNGDVSYKDVYLDYYASALEAIARSEIPDELKDVIINYFTSLE